MIKITDLFVIGFNSVHIKNDEIDMEIEKPNVLNSTNTHNKCCYVPLEFYHKFLNYKFGIIIVSVFFSRYLDKIEYLGNSVIYVSDHTYHKPTIS